MAANDIPNKIKIIVIATTFLINLFYCELPLFSQIMSVGSDAGFNNNFLPRNLSSILNSGKSLTVLLKKLALSYPASVSNVTKTEHGFCILSIIS